jgi:hypothetical protein
VDNFIKNFRIMKKLFVLLTLIACACVDSVQVQPPSPAQAQHVTPAQVTDRGRRTGTFYTYFNDYSNTVHTVVVEADAQENDQGGFGPLTMPSGYVQIGGGAYTSETEAGGYLIASYPCPGCSSWLGESHDHQVADTHTITVYSVGLKLDGVSATTLASHITYPTQIWLGPSHTPAAAVTVASGYTLIGGGARVINNVSKGNFLTWSYPSGNTWNVGSKDINVSSLADIEAFAVGIHTTIPGFVGELEIDTTPQPRYNVSSGLQTQSFALATGWAPAGIGAISSWATNGRILTGMRPPCATNSQYQVQTKDCMVVSTGGIDLYPIKVRKKPIP